MIQRGYDQPELGEGAHQVPDAGTLETVFRDQGQTGGKTAGVFKPDFVNCAVCCGVVKEGGLGRLIVLDGYVMFNGQLDGPLIGDGGRPGDALDKGQGPIVAVVGRPKKIFSGGISVTA